MPTGVYTRPDDEERSERRKRVAGLRLSGATMQEIANIEGVGLATIDRDMKAIRAEWRQYRLEAFEGLQDLEARRMDIMLNAVWAKAASGDEKAIDTVMNITAQRRKLLGLDAPMRVETKDMTERDDAVTLDDLLAILPADVVAQIGEAAHIAAQVKRGHGTAPRLDA
jgi:hypothetical protein